MKSLSKTFKVALCQTKAFAKKTESLEYVKRAVIEAASNKAQICVLGEIFNTLYEKQYVLEAAERFDGKDNQAITLSTIKSLAKDNNVYIVGSIPERADNDHC